MKVILLDGLVIFHVNNFFCKISVCLLFLSLVPKRGIAPGCKWLDVTTCSVSSALVTFPMCLCGLGHYLGDFGWQRVLWDVGGPCGFPLTIQQLNSYLFFFLCTGFMVFATLADGGSWGYLGSGRSWPVNLCMIKCYFLAVEMLCRVQYGKYNNFLVMPGCGLTGLSMLLDYPHCPFKVYFLRKYYLVIF